MTKLKTEIEKAYNYACLLLKFRDRCSNEIVNKLSQKGFSQKVINFVIKKLTRLNFLNDEKFVDKYIIAQLNKGKSLFLILSELQQKFGIDITKIKNIDVYKKMQNEIVLTLIRKKFLSKYHNLEDEKLKNKLYNYLLQKGFEDSQIQNIFSQLNSINL